MAHGFLSAKIYYITESFIIFCIKYAAPSWCRFSGHEHIKKIKFLLNKLIRLNYLTVTYPKMKSKFASFDERSFSSIVYSIRFSHLFSLHFVICEDD